MLSMLSVMVPSLNVNDQPINDASSLVRPANLRGMSSDHTLLLLNGKRRHRSAVITFLGGGLSDGAQGPDISVIPAYALKQVEVLRDGAAAQYGSDAIAGVINFVLKDAREGGHVALKVGGYSRSSTYYKELNSRMDNLRVRDIESYLLKAYGNAEQALENIGFGSGNTSGKEAAAVDALRKTLENGGELRKIAGAEEAPLANEIFEKWLSEVKLLNTKTYVDEVTTQARYTLEKNSNPPRKVGTTLELFDCLTCDKCIPVCPNDANFVLKIPQGETEILEFENNKSGWSVNARSSLKLAKKYQIANFADFCNECGNCDIFCPEDGGPYLLKPRFFGSRETFQEFSYRDGFYIEHVETDDQASTVFSRFDGKEYRVSETGNTVNYSGPDF